MGGERTAGVRVWPDGTCLVTKLLQELRAWDTTRWPGLTVVLPTKRLQTWLLAALSEETPAFVPPKLLTFDEFIRRSTNNLQGRPPLPRVIDALETELVLASLIKESSYKHLRPGHEHEIAQLDNDLVTWGIADLEERLMQVLADDELHGDEARVALHERFAELGQIMAQFQAALTAGGMTTQKRQDAALSAFLATHLAGGTPLTGEWTYIVGIDSRTGADEALVRALARAERLNFWVNQAPANADAQHPIKLLHQWLGDPTAPDTAPSQPRIALRRSATVQSEAAAALHVATTAIAAGCPPAQIAILVADESTYGKPLRQFVKQANLDANIALATPLSETPVGRWLGGLLNLAAQQETAAAMASLLTDPLTRAWFDDAHGQGKAPTAAAIWDDLAASEVPFGLAHLMQAPRLSPSVREYTAALAALTQPWRELVKTTKTTKTTEQATIKAWHAALTAAASPMAAIALRLDRHAAVTEKGRATAANEQWVKFTATLARYGEAGASYTPTEFIALVQRQLLAAEVRSVGEPLCGLQVLSIEEARYVPFSLVMIIGAMEGSFPRKLPQDLLLDNFLKKRVGLPGWQAAQAIEDTTFRLLAARLPLLAMSYPERRGNAPAVRSRYIEKVLLEQPQLPILAWDDAPLMRAFGYRETPVPRRQGASQGRVPVGIEHMTQTLSATALGKLITCPYQYLLDRMGVAASELADDDDTRAEGKWLHNVLEAFFTSTADGDVVIDAFDEHVTWDDFDAYGAARLAKLTAALAPSHVHESPLGLQLTHASWPAFLSHLRTLYKGQPVAAMLSGQRELSFGWRGIKIDINVGDTRHHFDGKIDSVDRMADQTLVITDYKRSGSGISRQGAVRAGTAPQLPLYALALSEHTGASFDDMLVGYWNISKGAWHGVVTGGNAIATAKAASLIGAQAKPALKESVDAVATAFAWRREGLTQTGVFAVDPSECGYCEFAGICRRDDPEYKAQIAKQDDLRRFKKERGIKPATDDEGDEGGLA